MLVLCAVWSHVHAAQDPQPYRVGVEDIDYRPYQNGLNGGFEGFGRELLDAFARDRGIRFEYRPMPPSRLLESLLHDRIDFKYPDDPDWHGALRQGYEIHYSRPIVGYLDGSLVPPERFGRPAAEIRRLGIVLGFTPAAWTQPIQAGRVALMENADFSALFQQAMTGRVDAAYADVRVARAQSQRLFGSPDLLVYDPGLPHASGHYRLSSIRHAGLIEDFDRWLAANAALVSRLERQAGLLDPPGSLD
ncbi:hypothetical protein D779_3031 [Imhoffiella purpurea]|uniref:Solute-binding protein family 3/N-terminal domain-containing protein n=1 Tax=Imhoffiella purpurea TaxID=1249627 RepID=W9V407_9GAMM|nr:hypothetical protein D779_3031 [Imhoffiella purpurea]